MKTIKELWRSIRLAFDPGYPLLTEFQTEVWLPTTRELKDK